MNANSVNIADPNIAPSQRIDKWLWCIRFFKTRSLASKFVSGSAIRITRDEITQRIEKPSALVRPGDRLAFSLGERVRIIEICALAVRRGPAKEAVTLYNDLSPPAPQKEEIIRQSSFTRDKGAGRPTKKDRRSLDALKT